MHLHGIAGSAPVLVLDGGCDPCLILRIGAGNALSYAVAIWVKNIRPNCGFTITL
ncbi:hypothetical protein XIS1_2360002 [Xenorhabdus innexi]|uniref:Uncharacterized protein n=1 Tax=Xenorhabdus innexi TaxID=290109 RepID=A0A1N6MX61_9GAMM|nr:hypothetical protein XIS1_2360002 [Xenorhabdus innexi]